MAFETIHSDKTGRVLRDGTALVVEIKAGEDRTKQPIYRDATEAESLTLLQAAILAMHDQMVAARWKD